MRPWRMIEVFRTGRCRRGVTVLRWGTVLVLGVAPIGVPVAPASAAPPPTTRAVDDPAWEPDFTEPRPLEDHPDSRGGEGAPVREAPLDPTVDAPTETTAAPGDDGATAAAEPERPAEDGAEASASLGSHTPDPRPSAEVRSPTSPGSARSPAPPSPRPTTSPAASDSAPEPKPKPKPKPRPEPQRREKGRTGGRDSTVLTIAADLSGIPYVWGGTTTRGFDCSGYTQHVFRRAGVDLPRTAAQQQRATRRVSRPRPGDLVFFGSPAHHVGIYAGAGRMYDAPRRGRTTGLHRIWSSNVTYGRPR